MFDPENEEDILNNLDVKDLFERPSTQISPPMPRASMQAEQRQSLPMVPNSTNGEIPVAIIFSEKTSEIVAIQNQMWAKIENKFYRIINPNHINHPPLQSLTTQTIESVEDISDKQTPMQIKVSRKRKRPTEIYPMTAPKKPKDNESIANSGVLKVSFENADREFKGPSCQPLKNPTSQLDSQDNRNFKEFLTCIFNDKRMEEFIKRSFLRTKNEYSGPFLEQMKNDALNGSSHAWRISDVVKCVLYLKKYDIEYVKQAKIAQFINYFEKRINAFLEKYKLKYECSFTPEEFFILLVYYEIARLSSKQETMTNGVINRGTSAAFVHQLVVFFDGGSILKDTVNKFRKNYKSVNISKILHVELFNRYRDAFKLDSQMNNTVEVIETESSSEKSSSNSSSSSSSSSSSEIESENDTEVIKEGNAHDSLDDDKPYSSLIGALGRTSSMKNFPLLTTGKVRRALLHNANQQQEKPPHEIVDTMDHTINEKEKRKEISKVSGGGLFDKGTTTTTTQTGQALKGAQTQRNIP